jgi:hypothetical protein
MTFHATETARALTLGPLSTTGKYVKLRLIKLDYLAQCPAGWIPAKVDYLAQCPAPTSGCVSVLQLHRAVRLASCDRYLRVSIDF